MDNDTVFYILGIGLVLAALAVAFAGIRFERFPASRGVLIGATLLFAALVVATATFAWRNAEDEQQRREAELAADEQQNLEEGDTGEAQEEGAGETTSTTTTASVDGAQVFDEQGCGGCHTLSDAGSTGTVGPVLDDALKGQSAKFVETSIVDPNAEIEQGFPPNTMPDNYGEILSPEELDALVSYLVEATNAKG